MGRAGAQCAAFFFCRGTVSPASMARQEGHGVRDVRRAPDGGKRPPLPCAAGPARWDAAMGLPKYRRRSSPKPPPLIPMRLSAPVPWPRCPCAPCVHCSCGPVPMCPGASCAHCPRAPAVAALAHWGLRAMCACLTHTVGVTDTPSPRIIGQRHRRMPHAPLPLPSAVACPTSSPFGPGNRSALTGAVLQPVAHAMPSKSSAGGAGGGGGGCK